MILKPIHKGETEELVLLRAGREIMLDVAPRGCIDEVEEWLDAVDRRIHVLTSGVSQE